MASWAVQQTDKDSKLDDACLMAMIIRFWCTFAHPGAKKVMLRLSLKAPTRASLGVIQQGHVQVQLCRHPGVHHGAIEMV